MLQAIVLGLVQGLTEFLPVSSSGHLTIVPYLFAWESPPLAFDVALHAATLVAVIAYFAGDLWFLATRTFGIASSGPEETRRARTTLGLLAVGSIPAGAAGYFLEDTFEDTFSDPRLAAGFLFLTLVPSTVQSSITFVAIARGHVSAAVVSASVSNLLGVVITPLLVFALMTTDGSVVITWNSVGTIALQLLLPFVVGQLLRTWVLPVIRRIKRIALFDKTVIVLVVYAAFSDGVADGIWSTIGVGELAWLIVACCVLLAVVLGLTELASRALGFEDRDKRVVQFCGSKKSLATGLPMAAVLFVGQPIGLLVLPLMLFHQIQLIVCAWLAGRYGRAAGTDTDAGTDRGAGA